MSQKLENIQQTWNRSKCGILRKPFFACAAQDPSGTSTLDRTQLQQLCCTLGHARLDVVFFCKCNKPIPNVQNKTGTRGQPMNHAGLYCFYFVFPFKRPPGTLTLIISPSSFKIHEKELRLSKSDIIAWSPVFMLFTPKNRCSFHWKSQQLLVSTIKPLVLDGLSWQASTRHLAELDSVAFWSSKFEVPFGRYQIELARKMAVMTNWAMKKNLVV